MSDPFQTLAIHSLIDEIIDGDVASDSIVYFYEGLFHGALQAGHKIDAQVVYNTEGHATTTMLVTLTEIGVEVEIEVKGGRRVDRMDM